MKLPILIFTLVTTIPAFADNTAGTCEQALETSADFSRAAALAESLLRKNPDNRETLLCLGRARGKMGAHQAALAALRAAEKLSATPSEHIVGLVLLGNQYKSVQDHAAALETYRQSLSIARAEKNTPFERICLNLIGESLQGTGDPSAALEHYQAGMQLAANDNERADSNGRLAAAHSALGNHDKAIAHQLKSMLLEERSGDLNHYANANIELGRICLAAKQYADAEKWLKKFLKAIEGAGADYWEAKARYLLGLVKAETGNAAESTEYFSQARRLAEKSGDPQLLMEVGGADPAKSR